MSTNLRTCYRYFQHLLAYIMCLFSLICIRSTRSNKKILNATLLEIIFYKVCFQRRSVMVTAPCWLNKAFWSLAFDWSIFNLSPSSKRRLQYPWSHSPRQVKICYVRVWEVITRFEVLNNKIKKRIRIVLQLKFVFNFAHMRKLYTIRFDK